MIRKKVIRRLASVLACAGLISAQLPQVAHAVQPPLPTANAVTTVNQTAPVQSQDVGLADGGTLRGVVVDNAGKIQPNTKVRIGNKDIQFAMVETDVNGEFTVQGLSGGVYQIETLQGGGVYRLWAPRTAPPAALKSVMIVQGDQVVRGANGQLLTWLGNPWVLGAVVATAIAVPLALDKRNGS